MEFYIWAYIMQTTVVVLLTSKAENEKRIYDDIDNYSKDID